jgi:hypothetical protein
MAACAHDWDEAATSILVSAALSVLTFPPAIYLINRGLRA